MLLRCHGPRMGQLLACIEITPLLDMTFCGCGSFRKPHPFLRTPFNESVAAGFPRRGVLAYISDNPAA